MKKLIILLGLGFAVVARASEAVPGQEVLRGVDLQKSGISFQVNSGGCTDKSHFEIQGVKDEFGVYNIRLVRLNPDFCEAYLPYGTKIFYSYQELGLKVWDVYNIQNLVLPGPTTVMDFDQSSR